MIKRNGQPREGVTPASLKRMSDTEHAAYFEAFGVIKGDYQALCLIGDKLRACRVLRGKLLVPRSELLKLLKAE